jgi:hypothetical protein
VNLRIKERLRRRLENEARKRDVSLNYEMTSRLEQSFEQERLLTLDTGVSDFEIAHAKFGQFFMRLTLQHDLAQAAKALIDYLPPDVREREAVRKAIELVEQTVDVMKQEGQA